MWSSSTAVVRFCHCGAEPMCQRLSKETNKQTGKLDLLSEAHLVIPQYDSAKNKAGCWCEDKPWNPAICIFLGGFWSIFPLLLCTAAELEGSAFMTNQRFPVHPNDQTILCTNTTAVATITTTTLQSRSPDLEETEVLIFRANPNHILLVMDAIAMIYHDLRSILIFCG